MNAFLLRWRVWIIVAIVLLYVAAISSQWLFGNDSSAYLLLAENLADGSGYKIFDSPHGKFPPGFPLYLAGLRLLGVESMLFLNACMVALALAALACSYRLLREHTSPRSALVGVIVTALLYQVYRFSVAQLTEVPFLLLVMAGLWCLTRGLRGGKWWLEAGALALAASCWVRVLGIPLTMAAAVGLVLAHRNVSRWRVHFNGLVLVAGALAAAAWLYTRDREVQAGPATGSYAAELSVVSRGNPLQWVGQALLNVYEGSDRFAWFITGQRIPPEVATVIFVIPMLVGVYAGLRKRHYVMTFAALGYLGAIFLLRTPAPRYYIPVAPILILWLGHGIRRLALMTTRKFAVGSAVGLTGACILLVANLPKDLRLIYRVHHPCCAELKGQQDRVCAAEFLRERVGEKVMFTSPRYEGVLSYLSRMPFLPLRRELRRDPPPGPAAFDYLRQENVNYVVLWMEGTNERPFHEALRQSVYDQEDYRLMFVYEDLHIFGRVCPEQPKKTLDDYACETEVEDGPRMISSRRSILH